MQLVEHNATGTTIDGEAVTKQLVNVALLLQAMLPPRTLEAPKLGKSGLSPQAHSAPVAQAPSLSAPVRSPTLPPRREESSSMCLSSLSAMAHSSGPSPLTSVVVLPAPSSPEPPPKEAATDMQVVGQCPGDKRKLADVMSAEAQIVATPVPGESGDDEPLEEKRKKQEHQDQHIEAKFRECLAIQAARTSSASSAPKQPIQY